MVEIGMKNKTEETVTREMLATRVGSGKVEVLATPVMIMMMELCCEGGVREHIGPGNATVGTTVSVKHMAATPQGMKVTVESELLEAEGKRLLFKVEAYDEVEKIGEGLHERYIVNEQKFISRVNAKLAQYIPGHSD